MGDMRRILCFVSCGGGWLGKTWRNYLDDGRGSAIFFTGLAPEDIYCFPKVVFGAMLLVLVDVTRNRCSLEACVGALVEVTMFRVCT